MLSSTEIQLRFAAEFVTFLAAAGGLALVALRAGLFARRPLPRAALGLGFVALAAASFLHGSLLVDDPGEPSVLGLRLLAVVGLAVGAAFGSAERTVRAGLGAASGLVLLAVGLGDGSAGANGLGDGSAGAVVLALAGLVLGVVLVLAGRRSVAARVAVSAAATLLVLVLVLSVALSAVLSATVERTVVDRIEARALTEATAIEDAVLDRVVPAARLAAASLEGDRIATLVDLAEEPRPDVSLGQALGRLSELFLADRPLLYLALDGTVVAASVVAPDLVDDVASSDVVADALAVAGTGPTGSRRPERSAVEVVGGTVYAVAVTVTGGEEAGAFRPLGAVVALAPLGEDYLGDRRRDDAALSLAVVGPEEVLAAAGPQPPAGELRAIGARVLAGTDGSAQRRGSERYLAARRVGDGDRGVAALVVSTPTGEVDRTRETLFRTLFLIALGGTLLALLLAALVGERIGAGLRRLTDAAGAVRRGDLSVRTAIRSDDEIGVLGETFDSMVVTLADTNEALRRAADDEARLRNRLEAIVEGMGEALVAVDREGRITDVNGAAERLFGVPRADALGLSLSELLELRAEADGSPLVPRVVTSEAGAWSATAFVGPGDELPVALTAGPLLGPGGERVGAVALMRDLREERSVERMKREFLSRVGHELRTPLAVITAYAKLLMRREVPREQATQWYETMAAKGDELERIIQLLEFFAAFTAGRLDLRPEELDVRPVIADVAKRWKARVGDRQITTRVARTVPPVLADRAWLIRSLDELVDNAVKFSPDGTRIQLTATVEAAGVVVTVADRGRGMTDEERARAFGDFVQGDTSDTRAYGGLGLGLSLVQRVAERHGGEVRMDSRPGRGTKVSLVLPAQNHRFATSRS